MNNPFKTFENIKGADGGPDYLSINEVDPNDVLDSEAIHKEIRTNKKLDLKFGEIGNENVANRKKAKKGPLRKIVIPAAAAFFTVGFIIAGKVDKDFLDESKRLEEQNKKNVVDDNILYGEDISRLITPSGKVFTVRTDGRSREEIEGILNKMANKTTKRKFGNDAIGE